VKKPRLLIADDHLLVLDGLKRLLEDEVELVGTAENGRDLVRMNEQLKPDVVLVDISMPELNGIDATRQLLKTRPDTKVIFVTMHADSDYLAEAFRAGAAGYVLKRSAASELVAAIKEVMNGRYYVTMLVTREALSPLFGTGDEPGKLSSTLTPRQREVL
jgi:DNA-binding NarL/FixJ family response regulator